jgi:hypothetical protein
LIWKAEKAERELKEGKEPVIEKKVEKVVEPEKPAPKVID